MRPILLHPDHSRPSACEGAHIRPGPSHRRGEMPPAPPEHAVSSKGKRRRPIG